MMDLRKHLAWLCSASLWCGTAAMAQEPVTFSPALEASHEFDVAKRFEQLQQRLDRLEAENGQLRQSLFHTQSGAGNGITPANAEMWNANAEAACPPQCQCPNCAPEKNGKGDWKTGWNNGIEWVSPDKAFKVHIGGRTQFDSIWYQNGEGATGATNPYIGTNGVGGILGGPLGTPGAGPHDQDAVAFRRARLRADGTIYETIDYVAEFDLVNSTSRDAGGAANTEANTINVVAPTDLWFRFKEVPFVGNVMVGNVKEPFGFEHNTSSRFLNFLERSFLQDLFAGPFNNGFTPGILLHNTFDDQHGTWAIGGFKNNYFNVFAYDVGDGEYATTGRLTYTPIFDEEHHQVLHIGVAGSYRDPDGGNLRFRTRNMRNGPANLATVFADTGTFTSSGETLAGAEVAGVFGSLSFQAEWMGAWCQDVVTQASTKDTVATGTSLGTVFVNGYYAEVHYFLTGETREYERKAGAFGRVVPKRNFRWKDGCFQPGAWQLAFRYGNADLRDGALNGGLLQEYVVGVNWFLNPNTKIQANYVCMERDSAIDGVDGGLIHGFGMRLAHDF